MLGNVPLLQRRNADLDVLDPRTTFVACTSRCTTWWRTRPGTMKRCWAQVRREVLPTMQKHGPVVMPGGNPIIKNPGRHNKFLSCDDINLATAPYVLDDTKP